jgi:hypothetical protein
MAAEACRGDCCSDSNVANCCYFTTRTVEYTTQCLTHPLRRIGVLALYSGDRASAGYVDKMCWEVVPG